MLAFSDPELQELEKRRHNIALLRNPPRFPIGGEPAHQSLKSVMASTAKLADALKELREIRGRRGA
jgi:hypothetical protein